MRITYDNSKQLEMLCSNLTDGDSVFDIGCGIGIPVAKYFSNKGLEVIGQDLTPDMVKYAKDNMPEAKFIKGDILNMSFPKESFNLITAFYSVFFHVDRKEHKNIFDNVFDWLKPGGEFYGSLGVANEEKHGLMVWEGDEIFYSYFKPETYEIIISASGFEKIDGKPLIELLGVGNESINWVHCKKPKK